MCSTVLCNSPAVFGEDQERGRGGGAKWTDYLAYSARRARWPSRHLMDRLHGPSTRVVGQGQSARPARHGQTSWLTALGQARASWTDCMAYSARRARRPRLPCRRAVDGLLVPGLLLPRSEGSQQQSRRLSRRVGDGLPCYLLGGRSRRSGSLIGPAAGAS